MAYVPAANVLMVELRGRLFAHQCENTLYFAHTGAIDAGEFTNLANWLRTVFIPSQQPYISTEYTWTETYGTDLTTSTSPTYSDVYGTPIAGTDAATAPMPGSIALCVSFRTNARGRSARGRNYVAGMTEARVADNLFNTTWVNAIVANYEALMGGGTFPSNWSWVALSRFENGAPRAAAIFREITDVLSTDLEVDSQRKRVK